MRAMHMPYTHAQSIVGMNNNNNQGETSTTMTKELRLCRIMKSLIVAMVIFTEPVWSQYANQFAPTCNPQVNPAQLPRVSDGLIDAASTINYGPFIEGIQRAGLEPRFRVLESKVVCEGISWREDTFQSLSLVLRIECQYCEDDEVTSGVRDADGMYEYSVQVSAYCGSVGFVSNLRIDSVSTSFTFLYIDTMGQERSATLRPQVVIRPSVPTLPSVSRQCAVCAAEIPMDIPLNFNIETWCYSKFKMKLA